MANFDASLVALIIYLFKRIQKTWGGVCLYQNIACVTELNSAHNYYAPPECWAPYWGYKEDFPPGTWQCCKHRRINQYNRI